MYGILSLMPKTIVCQGREVDGADLRWLRTWLAKHRHQSRHQLTLALCRQWDWRTSTGQLKNYAARSLLLKLEQRGFMTLPPIRTAMRRVSWSVARNVLPAIPTPVPIRTSLADLTPLSLLLPKLRSSEDRRFSAYLAQHHYLGFHRTVGENLKYLVRDAYGRDLACVLFGSAAWKLAPRDAFIGWSDQQRQRHLSLLTNNTRFLILPWVVVPHLASHILGMVLRQLCADWRAKYGHPIHLVETFVDRARFRGTCYRATSWQLVGQTRGRSRQDRFTTLRVPVKDIYVYPLLPQFREPLASSTGAPPCSLAKTCWS